MSAVVDRRGSSQEAHPDEGTKQWLDGLRTRKEDLLASIQALETQMLTIQGELKELDAFDREALGGSEAYKEQQMKKAVREFNAKPKRGIACLVESELVEEGSAEQIAAWLYQEENLKKGAIGEYLGEFNPLNLKVLEEFSKQHNFKGQAFDMALRQFLGSFKLPGEAQKIDRMMEAYAARYCACNPGVFANSDTCYILAFATIMLNTGLHNPAVKNKQTLESFMKQVSGINDGSDLPEDMLTELFKSIQTDPFKLPEDEDGTLASVFMNPERSGYLTKEGGKSKTWKKRWFTLVNGCLYYFEKEAAKTPKGIVPLENLKVEALPSFTAKKNCFELTSNDAGGTVKGAKTNSKGQFVQARHTSYKIAAESPEVMDEWMKCIRAAMSPGFGYDLFSSRKLAQTGGAGM